jgi:hypothetical protein
MLLLYNTINLCFDNNVGTEMLKMLRVVSQINNLRQCILLGKHYLIGLGMPNVCSWAFVTVFDTC